MRPLRYAGVTGLVVTAVLVVAFAILAVNRGSRWVPAGTPASPDTFLTEARQGELGSYASYLLTSGRDDSVLARLRAEGFERTKVDTARKVVTLAHAHARRWHEYLYTPAPLGAPYATAPVLTVADVPDWDELRAMAREFDPAQRDRRGHLNFWPNTSVSLLRWALGDSVVLDLARRPITAPITAREKQLVLDSLNLECRIDSRFVERPYITYEGKPPALRVGGGRPRVRSFAPELLQKLLATGVIRRAPDGRHLLLGAPRTDLERHALEWLNVGLMNQAYGDLLEAHDYSYDRQLAEHWYYRSW